MLQMILSLLNCLNNYIYFAYSLSKILILMVKELSATNVLRNKVTIGNQHFIFRLLIIAFG